MTDLDTCQPKVTIVIATYNRPDVLGLTIKSVLLQTESSWKLLVIGDSCDARTQSLMDTFDDPRIKYINLSERCAEQSGPNSVGLLLAETDYVALLNHDDLWLPDHLQKALAELQKTGASLFVGRSAFCYRMLARENGQTRPFFLEISLLQRKLYYAYLAANYMYEPSSSWVMRRPLINAAGVWRSTRNLYRTSLQDWLLRAWRAGATLCQSEAVTVLKFNTHHQGSASQNAAGGTGQYNWGNTEQAAMFDMLANCSPEQMRQQIAHDLSSQPPEGLIARDPFKLEQTPPSRLMNYLGVLILSTPAAWVYRLTGLDGFNLYAKLCGMPKGRNMAKVVAARVGETLPPPYDLQKLVASARVELNKNV